MEPFTTLYATQGLIASGKAPGKGAWELQTGWGRPGPREGRAWNSTEAAAQPRPSVQCQAGCTTPRNVTGCPTPAGAGRRLQNLEIPL